MVRASLVRGAASLGLLILTAACGSRQLVLPPDPGTFLAGFAAIHADVSDACRNVRTLTAVLSLSGRAGGERVRGDVHTGIRRPAQLRLEGVTPFGGTVFLLVTAGDGATLWLAQEGRVVRHESAEEILGALTGIALAPADLQAVLTGCVIPDPQPVAGRTHEGGWISIDLEGGARVYLRRIDGTWRVRAAQRGEWLVQYPEWAVNSRFPSRVELRSDAPAPVDLRADISSLQANVELPDAVFTLEVPADAVPLSIETLREGSPLRQEVAEERE